MNSQEAGGDLLRAWRFPGDVREGQGHVVYVERSILEKGNFLHLGGGYVLFHGIWGVKGKEKTNETFMKYLGDGGDSFGFDYVVGDAYLVEQDYDSGDLEDCKLTNVDDVERVTKGGFLEVLGIY